MDRKPTYHPLSGFYKKAKQYQVWYKQNMLNIIVHDKIAETMLTDEDAQAGNNFNIQWPDLLNSVNERFTFSGGNKKMWKNMLRSEHIAFNIFIPIRDLAKNPQTIRFLNELIPGADIQKITKVEVEYVPPDVPKQNLLNDNTSFDTYIEYFNIAGEKCGLGIEVKYTEKSYPYGKTEKERMFDEEGKSLYHQTTLKSNLYLPNSIYRLREKSLKQLWRNHLLGEKMKQIGLIDQFTSVHLYPLGNNYQEKCTKEYVQLLSDSGKQRFVALTFEKFIHLSKTYFTKPTETAWISYLEKRYIVN